LSFANIVTVVNVTAVRVAHRWRVKSHVNELQIVISGLMLVAVITLFVSIVID